MSASERFLSRGFIASNVSHKVLIKIVSFIYGFLLYKFLKVGTFFWLTRYSIVMCSLYFLSAVFETADYYWNFDRFPETVKSGQHPNLPAYSFYTSTPNVYEAGRRSRVATCGTGQKKCARFSSPLPCIT